VIENAHELETTDDADRVLICPECPYRAVMEDGQLVRLVPGDPTITHWAVW